ncbi:MAG: tetratricopeptide repeat protein [Bacteroidales bacterium]|nr:tetratricopeptide repeat protein [Bacteroidales bacterium]
MAAPLLTFLVYIPLFRNNFISSWDDDRYILNNPHIMSLDAGAISGMFSTYYDGHYHPLTLVSLAFDFAIAGKDPVIFHFHNLLLHLINTLLVFFLVKRLSKSSRNIIPGVAALLFGISAMHVESVAWAAERKNLLFSAFFFGSLLLYLKYISSHKLNLYVASLALFLLSLLSKASALTLAPTVLLIDYFAGRNLLSRKVMAEKAPFFLLAITAGLVAILAQKHTWGENLSQNYYPFAERLFYAGKALTLYAVKLFVPAGLSAFYPYTEISVVTGVAYTALAAGMIFFALLLLKKSPIVGFGIMFFFINISLLLKLFEVPAGDYFMADRYSYAASAGLFLIAGYGVDRLLNSGKILRIVVLGLLGIYFLMVFLHTMNRVTLWKTDESFYSDIIDKYPDESVAYLNRGAYRKENGNLRGALADFSAVIRHTPGNYKGYANRAAVYLQLSDNEKAAKDYMKAVKLRPGRDELYGSLGLALLRQGDYREALTRLDTAILLNPSVPEYYNNRGNAWYAAREYQKAIADYSLAILKDSLYANALFNRGIAFLNLNNLVQAETDFSEAIRLNPRNAEAFMNRAIVWSRQGAPEKAFADYDKAIAIHPGYTEAYLNRGVDLYRSGKLNEALDDLNKTLSLNPNLAPAYYFRGLTLIALGKKEQGCNDITTASNSGFYPALSELTILCK